MKAIAKLLFPLACFALVIACACPLAAFAQDGEGESQLAPAGSLNMEIASSGWTYPNDSPEPTANLDGHSYASDGLSRTRAATIKSHLHLVAGNVLERVEFNSDGLFVERISDDYARVTARRIIDPETFEPSNLTSTSNFAWGGFFSGATHNYVVTGQQNLEENDDIAVVRVTKYTKDWDYVASAELKGGNSYHIFSNGSCRMTELDGKLYIRTNHAIYKTDAHHEENITLVVNESTMKFTASWCYDKRYDGWVSHSWNQFVTTLGGKIYSLDHGDTGLRRGAIITQYRGDTATSLGSYARLIKWAGESSYRTDGMIGGFESSESNGTLIAVGNQYVGMAYEGVYKPWIAVAANPATLSGNGSYDDRTETAGVTLRYLDPNPNDASVSAANPYLVKINDNKHLVMWNQEKNSSYNNGKSIVHYQLINGRGEAISELKSTRMLVSDCQPIVRMVNGRTKVVWYAGGTLSSAGFGYTCSPTSVAFYELDVTDASNIQMSTTGIPIGMAYAELDAETIYDESETTYGARYQGGPVEPAVKASFFGESLTEGVDYTVRYENNESVGPATAVVTGKGAYGGTRNIDFTILPGNLLFAEIESIPDQRYTGAEVRPEPVVTMNGKLLVRDVDYTVSYQDNIEPGGARVVVAGINNYTMSKTEYFYISAEEGNTDSPDNGGAAGGNGGAGGDAATDVNGSGAANGGDNGGSGGGNNAGGNNGSASAKSDLVDYKGDASAFGFVDLDGNAWYMRGGKGLGSFENSGTLYLDYTVGRGLMTGTDATHFAPGEQVSRAQVAMVLFRLGNPGVGNGADANKTGLRDVVSGQWYTRAVNWCFNEGVVTGYKDAAGNPYEFRPNDPVSREEMALMFARFCMAKGGMQPVDAAVADEFPDAGDISSWAREGVAFCKKNGIISGKSNTGRFDPHGNSLRCEMSKVVAVAARMME